MPTFREDIKLGTKVPLMKTDDINDQAITKDKIRDGNVTTEKLADGAVKSDKISDASITTPKIANGNVTEDKIDKSAVTTSKIADQSVTTEKIADQSVNNAKLSPSAVTYDKIKDSAVITEKLNDRAITTEKVEEKAITNPKLGDQAVDGRVIREASVETKHIANDSVTADKLAEKSVTSSKLADQSVDGSKLADGSVGNQTLADDSVTKDKIKDGSVTNEKLADGTLKIDKLDPELRKTIESATGLPEDLTQMIQDIDETLKDIKDTDEKQQAQINDNTNDIESLKGKSDQLEQSIKDISVSGGASTANAVSYNNETSGLDSINAQGAIDELASKKVDKEEGKSLIDDEIKERFAIIENEEFLEAKVDADEKVLEGITTDGNKQINLPTTVPSVTIKGAAETTSMENEEFLDLKVDRENHILEGITRDGEKVLPLPITGNPTIYELRQEIANVKEQAKRSYLEIEFDEDTGDLNAIISDNSTITNVTTDDDGNIYLEEDIATSSEPETMTTLASVDETKETAIFNK